MWESNAAGLPLPVPDVHAGASKNNVEVHTVDTDGGIVFDTQINVFLNTESKVAVFGEVLATQLVFTDLEQNRVDFKPEENYYTIWDLTFRPRSRISSALAPRTVQ